MSIKDKFDTKNKTLLKNTVLLYIMTFSSQLFNVATLPYLTRVLGPSEYGKVGIAVSFMAYVQIIIDFGFILSATRKVAENKDDKNYISKLFTSVFLIKLAFSVIVSVAFLIIVLSTDLRNDMWFYILYLISQICYALLPDFLYRGLENMRVITYRTVVIKALFTVLVFIFVKDASDLMLVPLFTLIGNVFAVGSMYLYSYRRKYVMLTRVSFKDIKMHFVDSSQFFASRVSSTVYQASNTIILGVLYGDSSPITGFYTSADKIVSLTKSASSPVADSLYPYMVKNRNYGLVKKLLAVTIPLILAAGIICFIFPCQICSFIFGSEYYEAGNILRCLLPTIMVIFPNYILAFPVMVPLGLTKKANFSNIFGLVIEVVLLLSFYIFNILNVYTLCIATSITEVAVLLFRLTCVILKIKGKKEL